MRKSLKWFAERMEETLQANDHKGGWDECTMDYLRHRLRDEYLELCAAMVQEKPSDEIIREATDVANFAMMIADRMKRMAAGA